MPFPTRAFSKVTFSVIALVTAHEAYRLGISSPIRSMVAVTAAFSIITGLTTTLSPAKALPTIKCTPPVLAMKVEHPQLQYPGLDLTGDQPG